MNRSRVVDLRPGRPSAPKREPDSRKKQPSRERRSTLRDRKRRVRAVISAAVSVCLLLSVYAVHLASYMQRFTFQKVTVTGMSTVQASDIAQFAEAKLAEASTGFISGRNIFIYRFSDLEDAVEANFPAVREAHVSRDTSLGNGLIINISERVAYARWCAAAGGPCYQLDDMGVVFAPLQGMATSGLATQYEFAGQLSTSTVSKVSQAPLGAVYSSGHFPGILSLLKVLGQNGHEVLSVHTQDENDLFVSLSDGFYLKVSFGEDPAALARNLDLVLSSQAIQEKKVDLEYIDLRFGNRVYYKLKGQAAIEPK